MKLIIKGAYENKSNTLVDVTITNDVENSLDKRKELIEEVEQILSQACEDLQVENIYIYDFYLDDKIILNFLCDEE